MPVIRYVDNQPEPKVYKALLNQSGTSAPVATVLQNTLGATPVYSRVVAGEYNITLAGAFPVGKTHINMKYLDPNIIIDFAVQPDSIFIKNFNLADDFMFDLPIEIIVYY